MSDESQHSDGSFANLLDRYKPQSSHVAAVSSTVDDIAEEIKGYQAWGSDKANANPRGVMVYEGGEAVSAIFYPYLYYPYTTSHKLVGLHLTFGHVTIKGKHLTELIGLLSEQRIAWIRKWNAKEWSVPDEGVPVITEIEWRINGEDSL